MSEPKPTMRTPFPERLVNKLPKGTKAQNDCPPSEKVSCKICGGFHHPKIIHLDYIGHAALTDRLLDVDPEWNWEPLALRDGLPAFDESGGLWIRLTVNGVSRLGYGHAAHKAYMDIGSREKEVIGDALRNAAMRFGAALDLWFKGDLHPEEPVAPAMLKGTITPTTGAWDAMDPEQQKDLNGIAVKIKDLIANNDVDGAIQGLKEQHLGADEYTALWTRFDSKQRSALKGRNTGVAAKADSAVSIGQIAFIRKKIESKKLDEAAFCSKHGVTDLDAITAEQWTTLKNAL